METKYYILIQDDKEYHKYVFYGGRPFSDIELKNQLKTAIKIYGAERVTVVLNIEFDFNVTIDGFD
jgi:hypothetical protein